MATTHITQAQTALASAGFYKNVIDGDFGKDSLKAVMQALNNIEDATETLVKVDIPPKSEAKSGFALSKVSKERLAKVHLDLQRVVNRAIQITTVDFTVGEGMRTLERQRELVKKGASQTMNSRHLTGHAVDLIALDENGSITWDWKYYYPIETAMMQAAKELGIIIEWGGRWTSFKDGPHYQLPWSIYPK